MENIASVLGNVCMAQKPNVNLLTRDIEVKNMVEEEKNNQPEKEPEKKEEVKPPQPEEKPEEEKPEETEKPEKEESKEGGNPYIGGHRMDKEPIG